MLFCSMGVTLCYANFKKRFPRAQHSLQLFKEIFELPYTGIEEKNFKTKKALANAKAFCFPTWTRTTIV
jgi:hypothetical protein